MDIGTIVQAILYGLFALFTAALTLAIAPTYDNLLVPELARSQLYPSLTAPSAGAPTYLAEAARFSQYLLVNLVDPAIALVAVAIGLLFLLRAVWSRSGEIAEGLITRFVIAVVLANFVVPIAGGILDLGSVTFPVVAGWDGGAWTHWTNLAGTGEFAFSWQNGALTFVLVFVQFSLVLLLTILVGVRDATLAVLLVVLPAFTLLWPIRPFAGLARRGWLLFVELAFLPCVLVIPLELAVGSPNVILLVAFLSVALASPYLLSISGAQLSNLGFPSVGSALTGGVERGLQSASRAPSSVGGAFASSGSAGVGGAVSGLARSVGSVALPAAAPAVVADAIGRGAKHLAQHIRPGGEPVPKLAPMRSGRSE